MTQLRYSLLPLLLHPTFTYPLLFLLPLLSLSILYSTKETFHPFQFALRSQVKQPLADLLPSAKKKIYIYIYVKYIKVPICSLTQHSTYSTIHLICSSHVQLPISEAPETSSKERAWRGEHPFLIAPLLQSGRVILQLGLRCPPKSHGQVASFIRGTCIQCLVMFEWIK